MSDNKRWFKVWSSILVDPHHLNLTLESAGRWVRLGAMMVVSGDNGRLEITPPAKAILAVFDCPNLDALKVALNVLPNVHVEEGKSDNGEFTVIMQNWSKYQNDSTVYERVKRLRSKRRGEEKRGEEKRKEENIPPKPPASLRFQKPTAKEVEEYAMTQGFRIDAERFLAYYDARGWQFKNGQPVKSWQGCVTTWKKNGFGGFNGHHDNKRAHSPFFDGLRADYARKSQAGREQSARTNGEALRRIGIDADSKKLEK